MVGRQAPTAQMCAPSRTHSASQYRVVGRCCSDDEIGALDRQLRRSDGANDTAPDARFHLSSERVRWDSVGGSRRALRAACARIPGLRDGCAPGRRCQGSPECRRPPREELRRDRRHCGRARFRDVASVEDAPSARRSRGRGGRSSPGAKAGPRAWLDAKTVTSFVPSAGRIGQAGGHDAEERLVLTELQHGAQRLLRAARWSSRSGPTHRRDQIVHRQQRATSSSLSRRGMAALYRLRADDSETIDAHTAGEPLRLIIDGFPEPVRARRCSSSVSGCAKTTTSCARR